MSYHNQAVCFLKNSNKAVNPPSAEYNTANYSIYNSHNYTLLPFGYVICDTGYTLYYQPLDTIGLIQGVPDLEYQYGIKIKTAITKTNEPIKFIVENLSNHIIHLKFNQVLAKIIFLTVTKPKIEILRTSTPTPIFK